ncbi:maker529 [Drosophila busckii]|uniref:Maker529 n=1 Tax=Drosophila busckii TaxID=30019 RepID=A0A0M4EGI4_DROBS|nr:C-type lectin 37Db [Drosophila busckii]ALC39830.1 maker529 [Drosophila busckii]
MQQYIIILVMLFAQAIFANKQLCQPRLSSGNCSYEHCEAKMKTFGCANCKTAQNIELTAKILPISKSRRYMNEMCNGNRMEWIFDSRDIRWSICFNGNPEEDNTFIGKFQKLNDALYYFETEFKDTWIGALHTCRAMSANLISFDSEQQYNQVTGKLAKTLDFWTDINDLSNEQHYRSFTTGEPAPYTNWQAKAVHSKNATERCVALNRSKHMYPDKCTAQKYFICML